MYGSSSFPVSSPIQVRNAECSKPSSPEPAHSPNISSRGPPVAAASIDSLSTDDPSNADVTLTHQQNLETSLMSQSTSPSASSSSLLEVTDHLEIDRFDTRLGVCPLLLDATTYNADTVDLTRDPDARSYWLQCFEDSLLKFAQRAVDSQKEHSAGTTFSLL